MTHSPLPFLAYFIIAFILPPADMTAQVEPSARHGLSTREKVEIGAVAMTGLGHLVFRAMDATKYYIPLASIGWSAYVYHRTRTDNDFLSDVGFTYRGLSHAFRQSTLVAIGAAALMAGIGARNRSLTLHRNLIPLLLLYPAWGLVQQFLVQGLFSRNMTKARGWAGSSYLVTPLSAALFSSVHLPDWKLTAATFLMGVAFTPLYLNDRNLWPLGLYHGWLGALFFFWVLERNPWKEVFGNDHAENIRASIDVNIRGTPVLQLSVIF